MITIGITGTLGAGKGTIVDYLIKNRGFVHYSVRSFITEEINRRGLPVNRDSMTVVGNDLRAQHSPSWIVEQLYEQAQASGKNCIIESVRTAGEVEALRGKPNFYLFAVDADTRVRYERAVVRGSETDHVSFETFVANEEREMDNNDPNKQNLRYCIEQADYCFKNDGTIEELNQQVEKVLSEIMYRRPSWDEYFMELANTASKRATCDRGRSGCVIVKDRQLLVTGYVGAPSGLPHCDEVGHLFRKTIEEDGRVTTHCVRTVHAEQNAICQAARRGIALDGATLYCRMTPCRTCAMLIINCGIKRVVCERKYHAGKESEELFAQAGVQIEFFHDEVQQYANQ
ncbi:MAG: AAA family ATPase [Bacteroidales bacterium]|nr:AAA family ATPase [Bacteroidales bacterium]MBR3414001.1 AAA family ATPase [Bacteroidales bacterium]